MRSIFWKKHNNFTPNPRLLGATMRTIFSCIDESLRPPPFHATLCNLKRAWDTRQKKITKKKNKIRHPAVKTECLQQSGRTGVRLYCDAEQHGSWVFCQMTTGREVNAFQMFAKGFTEGMDWMHRVINHAMVLFCLSRTIDLHWKRHRRIYLSVPADWKHKGRRADEPKCSCQSDRFDVTSKHRSHRDAPASRPRRVDGRRPAECPRRRSFPGRPRSRTLPRTGFHVSRVWFQARIIPPAGADAASPPCWSISRWCLSLRREAATRWSSCLWWSTRPSLWWVPKAIPTVPSSLLKFQADIYFLQLHLIIHVYFFYFFL